MTSETQSTSDAPLSLKTYRTVTKWLKPVANFALSQRIKAGKEDPLRINERKGMASFPRPDGHLIWVHGVSVGESLSILPLIDYLNNRFPDIHFLVTTGTITSANLMEERLPENAIHQYAPVDQPDFVSKFLDHWKPDVALFVESELWPVLIGEIQSRKIPLCLVNGRLSPRSYKKWVRRPKAARALLDAFSVVMAQDKGNGERLSALAGREAICVGNLKRSAPPLPTNDVEFANLQRSFGGRTVWLAASTHPGEEELILDAHDQLKVDIPDLLTVIAPRHPNRGTEVQTIIDSRKVAGARRSHHDPVNGETEVYLADTLGELGLFYRLSDVAFIGGSLLPVGGHNPMEPARIGSAIVTGPHVFNFQETFNSMRDAGALALVRNERDLSASLLRLLRDERTRKSMSDQALKWSEEGAIQVLEDIVASILPAFPDSLRQI